MRTNKYTLLATFIIVLISVGLLSCTTSSPTLISDSSSQQSSLYAATSKPGKVYRYQENAESIVAAWEAISGELGVSVDAIIIFQGQLYAAASQNAWDGLSIIYRYAGGTSWSPVSSPFDAKVEKFAVYKEQLYASARNVNAGVGQLFRFDGDMQWTKVADSSSLSSGWQGFKTLYPWNDYLYIGDSNTDFIARFDGTGIEQVSYASGNGIQAMEVFQTKLFAGSFDSSIYQMTDGINFTQQTSGIDFSTIRSMQTYGDNLYIGMATTVDNRHKEQLYRWDNGAMALVWEQADSGSGAVLSMVANSTTLFFGTGEPPENIGAQGTGIVYAMDGQNISAISGTLGQAVTQLLVGALSPPLSAEITSAVVNPTSMLPGGTFLAYITLMNTGSSTAYITKSGSLKIANLPAGWSGEFTDAGNYGAPWTASTSVQPGGTVTVVAAITISCDTSPGVYVFNPTLIYELSGNSATYQPSPTYLPVSVMVQQDMTGTDLASYKHSQAAVRQIRALARNIGSGAITTSLNLTYFGIDGARKTVTINATGGYVYRDFYETQENGVQYQQDYYDQFLTSYSYASKYEYTYQSNTDNYYMHGLIETRPFYTFNLQSIPQGAAIVSADLVIYSGSSSPDTGDFFIKIHALKDDPQIASAQTIFDGAGSGALYADTTLLAQNSNVNVSLGNGFFTDLTAAAGGTFSVGIELDGSRSASDAYQESNVFYNSSYSNSLIYTSDGTDPSISADTAEFTNPGEALHIVLDLFLEGNFTKANEIASYINEQYYSLGYWDLQPGRSQCTNRNGNESNN